MSRASAAIVTGRSKFRALPAAALRLCTLMVFLSVACTPPGQSPPGSTIQPPTVRSRLYVSPATASAAPGSQLDLQIRVRVEGEPANAVAAHLNYSTSTIRVDSVAVDTSTWTITARSVGANGNVAVDVGTTTPVQGDHLVATLRVTTTTGELGALSFDRSSAVVSASTGRNQL
jgi:hypothetical protein